MREIKQRSFRNKKFKNQVSKKPKEKTRKDLRKEKRQQAKLKRHTNFLERQKLKSKNTKNKSKKAETKEQDDDFYDEDEDEEIPSDFEDAEVDEAVNVNGKKSKTTAGKNPSNKTQLELDRMKELKEQNEYEMDLKKKRIEQMMEAVEEDDKIIKKYEKLLKLNKRKSKADVPMSFNDGLDYALELCTPENIQKMYTAAKEAAELDEDSDNDFINDLDFATGKSSESTNVKSKKKKLKELPKSDIKTSKKMEKLKEVEKKYFGEDMDEFDSLQGSDSEFEDDDDDDEDDEALDANDEEFPSDTEPEDEDSASDVVEEPIRKKPKNGKQVSFNLTDNKTHPIEGRNKPAAKEKKNVKIIEKEESSDDNDFDDENGDFFDDAGDDDDDEFDEMMDDDNSLSGGDESNGETVKPSKKKTKDWEDIYGRKRDKDGNVIEEKTEKYVPPHIRARLEAENTGDPKRKEKLMRLTKQLKGLMNRLAESNMHRIVIDIDNMYMQNARFDMNNILTKLILEALVLNSLSPERMVLEHMCLIAGLHANVGSEVGAHFLQIVIEKFDKQMKKLDEYEVENKELDNVIFIISHLYTFHIFKHNLIYEMLDKLTENLSEKSVECILLILKAIGFALRKDDPVALKNFIIDLQKKASLAPAELRNNSRVKFMLDILLAIKNNNIHKMPQYDPSLAENFRKLLKTITTNGKYVSTLNITINDLLNADEKGKWWLVGSAWAGNLDKSNADGKDKAAESSGEFSQKLMELAKSQRMNTEDRKKAFCIIMSAEDYIDAFEKLIQLSLRDHRIIVTIIIQCCLSEKVFNPYYGVLAQKFSDHDRKYLLALQFAIWDKIKDISSLTSLQIKNLAQFLLYLIEQGGLALSVLKVIQFGELDKTTLRFVRQLLLGILLGKSEETCTQIFTRIAPSANLAGFKDSIRLFMHHFLLEKGSKIVSNDQMKLLKKRIHLVDRCMEMCDARIKF